MRRRDECTDDVDADDDDGLGSSALVEWRSKPLTPGNGVVTNECGCGG
jgi:hypothetical protein